LVPMPTPTQRIQIWLSKLSSHSHCSRHNLRPFD
jgi:hypothetical protein